MNEVLVTASPVEDSTEVNGFRIMRPRARTEGHLWLGRWPPPWPGALPPALVRFIGVSELAGAVGLLLPAVMRIKPILMPLATAGLVLVMVLAAAFHISRSEWTFSRLK